MAKKFFSAIAAFALLFTSCEMLTGEEAASGKFHLTSEATVTVPAGGECLTATYAIDEAVEGATMAATPSADWVYNITIDQEACSLTFCTKVNDGEARTATIELTYASAKATITINQEAAQSAITLSQTLFEIDADGNCCNVTYTLNTIVDGATVTFEPSADWLYISGENADYSEFSFCVKPNEGEARTATINVKYGEHTAVLTVNQAAGTPAEA